jgi:hypothetical protein
MEGETCWRRHPLAGVLDFLTQRQARAGIHGMTLQGMRSKEATCRGGRDATGLAATLGRASALALHDGGHGWGGRVDECTGPKPFPMAEPSRLWLEVVGKRLAKLCALASTSAAQGNVAAHLRIR